MSSAKPTGGPAFPKFGTDPWGKVGAYDSGLTVRDAFAIAVLQGMSGGQWNDPSDYTEIARRCYAQADAMLAARAEVKP